MELIIVEMGRGLSSDSKRRWVVGIMETVAGLNFSPNEMRKLWLSNCCANCGFPRKPCIIHGIEGFNSFLSAMISL